MKCKTILAVIACLSVSLSAGCSKKASTPKEAMENMVKAMRDGDSKAFVACFDATEDQEKVLGAMCEMMSAMMKFEEAMVDEYGEDAVKKGGSTGSLGDFKDDKWLEDLEIKIDGDQATAAKKGEKEPLNLVKKDGGWKIDAGDMTDENQTKDVDKALKMFEAMAKVTKDATDKIGKDGYTAEKINQEMGADMMKALMENAGMPSVGG
ncbi:MAG: hypothetical protein K8R91_02165 [Phycisphaerae bacterium]|nr:hypothetical protein [Phycisphaerae bacterium]